jgi:hypothetical protein
VTAELDVSFLHRTRKKREQISGARSTPNTFSGTKGR